MGITISAPLSQIEGQCVNAPRDTPYLIQMTSMAAVSQISYEVVKKTSKVMGKIFILLNSYNKYRLAKLRLRVP